MIIQDEFCKYYKEYLDGIYDCVDRKFSMPIFPWHNPVAVFVHGGAC
ncbi:MAG: hypothetical protein HRF42_15030 [Candidatus Brocadia sp.]